MFQCFCPDKKLLVTFLIFKDISSTSFSFRERSLYLSLVYCNLDFGEIRFFKILKKKSRSIQTKDHLHLDYVKQNIHIIFIILLMVRPTLY